MRVLLVAGSPEPSGTELVKQLALQVDTVMAIDRGAEVCRQAGVVPNAFCGDADTISSDTLAWITSHVEGGTPERELQVLPADEHHDRPKIKGLNGELGIRMFEPAKYDTDLSLGFACARQIAAELGEELEIAVTCASAGRMDHALAVFGVLAANADIAPVLIEDSFECQILSPKGCPVWEFAESEKSKHFSFVALSDGAEVSLDGMKWDLDHYHVDALRDRGISNVIECGDASVTVHHGIIAAFLIA